MVTAADYGAAAGDQLVVLQLPFGSFTPPQTPAVVNVTLNTSNLADPGTALPVQAIAGFAFGQDALNNPATDAPLRDPLASGSITPTLLTLSKAFSGPEDENGRGIPASAHRAAHGRVPPALRARR